MISTLTTISRNDKLAKQKLVVAVIAYIAFLATCSLTGQAIGLLFHKYILTRILR